MEQPQPCTGELCPYHPIVIACVNENGKLKYIINENVNTINTLVQINKILQSNNNIQVQQLQVCNDRLVLELDDAKKDCSALALEYTTTKKTHDELICVYDQVNQAHNKLVKVHENTVDINEKLMNGYSELNNDYDKLEQKYTKENERYGRLVEAYKQVQKNNYLLKRKCEALSKEANKRMRTK